MKLKILVGALIVLIAVNLATIGSYLYRISRQDGGSWRDAPLPIMPYPERRGGMPTDRPGRALRGKLSPADREQLMQLLSELRMETDELRIAVHQMESEVMAALRREPVPRERVDSLLNEISTVHLQISRKATDKMIEAKAHLTPEQQALFYDAILKARAFAPPNRGMNGLYHRGRKGRGPRGSGRERNADHDRMGK